MRSFLMRCGAASGLLAVFSGVGYAHNDLCISPPHSNFNCAGNSLLGALVGNPTGDLQFQGNVLLNLSCGQNGELLGQLSGGAALAVNDVSLEVAHLPLLPTVLSVEIDDLRLELGSNVFVILPNGQFTAHVVAVGSGGTLTVTLLSGVQVQVSLIGIHSQVDIVTGLCSGTGAQIQLTLPLELEIVIGDLGLGLGLKLDLDGLITCGKTFAPPTTYCVGKVNSLGCVAEIGSTGTASATAGSGFVVTGVQLHNQRFGLLFFGLDGRKSVPFQGGTLCVQPPLRRTPIQSSGGSPHEINDCTGTYAIDFNAHIAGQGFETGLRTPGAQVNAQWWSRDPALPSTTTLSNALEFTIGF